MATKSNSKSNNQKRGGKRPGAGRPRGPAVGEGADRAELLRNAAIEVALGGLDRALTAYESDAESLFTPLLSRWHLAMVLFGCQMCRPLSRENRCCFRQPGDEFRDRRAPAANGYRNQSRSRLGRGSSPGPWR